MRTKNFSKVTDIEVLSKTKLVKYMRRTKNIEPYASGKNGGRRFVVQVGYEEVLRRKHGLRVIRTSPIFSHPNLSCLVQVYFCTSLN